MLAEFLTRLAIALPLVCAAAVLSLWAVKRGWIRLPRLALRGSTPAAETLIDVLAMKALSPAARVAVIRFDGRTHLVGITAQAMQLLATAAAPGDPPADLKPEKP